MITVWCKKEHADLLGMEPYEAERFPWPMVLGQTRQLQVRKDGTKFAMLGTPARRFTVVPTDIDGRTQHPTGDVYYEVVSQP